MEAEKFVFARTLLRLASRLRSLRRARQAGLDQVAAATAPQNNRNIPLHIRVRVFATFGVESVSVFSAFRRRTMASSPQRETRIPNPIIVNIHAS
jgi:hypothetical protein